jgi:hypothetical protein
MVEELWYKPEGRGFETQRGEWIFSNYLTLSAALGPGVYSASNRNEHQKQREAGAYGWQPYRHLWTDCLYNVQSSTSYNPIGLHGLLRG